MGHMRDKLSWVLHSLSVFKCALLSANNPKIQDAIQP